MKLRYKYYSLRGGMQKVKTRTALAISAVTLALSGGTGLSLLTFSSAHADTGGAVIVTPTDTQGWSTADTRVGGDVGFVLDSTAQGSPAAGALRLTTDATTAAKAQYMHAANVPLSGVTDLSYQTKQNSASFDAGTASYQLAVCLTGVADSVTLTCNAKDSSDTADPNVKHTTTFTTLVYEPYVSEGNDAIHTGVWQRWDAASGEWYSSRSVAGLVGSAGNPTYNLEDLKTSYPDAVVIGYGVNVGSSNPSYDIEVDAFNFNGTTYNFEAVTAEGEITAPTAGEHVSGTLNLAASYVDNEVTNTDGVQWAVREGTCATGTNTVFGNVDGHRDASTWDGNDFAASLDVRNVTPGEYCFVFNPTDDPGQPNVRETVSFIIDQYYAQTSQDCKNNGWMTLHTANDSAFKNQGQCVSYVNHNNGVGQDDVRAKNN